MLRGRIAVAAIAPCAVALVACGGGGHRLSMEEYARRADAVCASYKQQVAKLGKPGSSLQRLAEFADRNLPILDRALARLKKLQPPKDEEALATRWRSSLDTLRGDAVKFRDRARANDLGGVAALLAPARSDNDVAHRLAAQLGMHVCTTT